MSRGLGKVQRAMVGALARAHLAAAEDAAQHQRRDFTGVFVSLEQAIRNAGDHELRDELTARIQVNKTASELHKADLERRARAGDRTAIKMMGLELSIRGWTERRRQSSWRKSVERPVIPRDFLEDYNPSRAVDLLVKRGLAHRVRAPRLNLTVSAAGFRMAMTVGALPASEIVDLEDVAAQLEMQERVMQVAA